VPQGTTHPGGNEVREERGLRSNGAQWGLPLTTNKAGKVFGSRQGEKKDRAFGKKESPLEKGEGVTEPEERIDCWMRGQGCEPGASSVKARQWDENLVLGVFTWKIKQKGGDSQKLPERPGVGSPS